MASGFAATLAGTSQAAIAAGTATTAQVMMTNALAAGMTQLASAATVSLINNKGDLGAVLRELGSSGFIKSLATNMITAGLVSSIPSDLLYPGVKASQLSFAQGVQQKLLTGALKALTTTTVSTAIQGGDFGDALLGNLQNSGIGLLTVYGHEAIGDFARDFDIPDGHILKVLAHAGFGGLISELSGRNFATGAAAGAVSEISSVFLDGLQDPNTSESIAKVIGGTVALLAGGGAADVNIAASIAGSADRNNRRLHAEEAAKLQALMQGKSEAERQRYMEAACALVHCAAGVPVSDPNYQKLLQMEKAGAAETNKAERDALLATGMFTYGTADMSNDWLSANAKLITKTEGVGNLVGGSLQVVGSSLLIPVGCATTGVETLGAGCYATVALASLGISGGWDQASQGSAAIFAAFNSTEGRAVLASFSTENHPGDNDLLAQYGGKLTVWALQAVLAKVGLTLVGAPPKATSELKDVWDRAKAEYGAKYDVAPSWKKAEMAAATMMKEQGLTVIDVTRNKGNGFDLFGFDAKTGKLTFGETKDWKTRDVCARDCTAFGLGKGGKATYEKNIGAVREAVLEDKTIDEATRRAIFEKLDNGDYTIQFYGTTRDFKMDNIRTAAANTPWLKGATIADPISLGPVK